MIRVLIVDDSAAVRKVFTTELGRAPDIEVVGAAPDPFVARDLIARTKPDVLTLDLEMPRMDGLAFLRNLMRSYPLPAVIVSSLTPEGSELALEAIASGAVDVVCKPRSAYSVKEMSGDLIDRVRAASLVNMKVRAAQLKQAQNIRALPSLSRTTDQVIGIGGSTGGTTAVETILRAFPPDAPGTVVTLHMPPEFTRSFAKRLDKDCRPKVREAKDGDTIVTGTVLIAPGDHHLLVERSGGRYRVKLKAGPRVNYHCPSVDVMFDSIAKACGGNAVGAILTGMGADGAEGLKKMHDEGAPTLAQDEASCVVYGMPKVAVELGGVDEVLPLGKLASGILRRVSAQAGEHAA